ncbi:MAG: efflux RND transporter periplasmic adaptor subunit [bacterium]|nr:efflux RND transporter periplasmic adaptor subunit [bacterium]
MKYIASVILFSFLSGIVQISCKTKGAGDSIEENIFYTCSMDPQVMEKKPGKCPICKMELTRVEVRKENKNTLRFSDSQLKLANIVVDTIKLISLVDEKRYTAKVVLDENETSVISARLMGRIDKLKFKSTGEYIKQGDLIYEMYSEELSAAQKDYLIANQRVAQFRDKAIDYIQLLQSAKQKLLLWGMNEAQIEKLAKENKVPIVTPFFSPEHGYIIEVLAKEGDYVAQGQSLFKINSLKSVWIEAQLYSSEIKGIHENQEAIVEFEALPSIAKRSKIDFISPELQQESKVNLVRIQLSNEDLAIVPGMLSSILLSSAQKQAIVLPIDAVLQEAQGNTVWVQNADSTFESRMVVVGIQNSRQIEVKEGLRVGERVVISGAYLINSEYHLKKGASPMEGHDMKDMKM